MPWSRCLLTCLMVLGGAVQVSAQAEAAGGDPTRGRAIVLDRQRGFCLLCHHGPFPEEPFQGDLAPDLALLVQGKSAQQLRDQLIDPTRQNPDTIMPRYGLPGLGVRVHPQFAERRLLQDSELDDVVAFLLQLKP